MNVQAPSTRRIRVDVILDTVCPWCYIGKRRLDKALAMRPDLHAEIRFHAFLLNPNMPREGVDQATYLGRRFGNEQRVARVLAAIEEAGQSESIRFAFDRIRRAPNSVDSHRLIHLAADKDAGERMVEALYRAYFEDGRDIGHPRELAAIAGEQGFDSDMVRAFLLGTSGIEDVLQDNAWAHRRGANGVPTFLFEGGPALSGAHEPKVLARMLDVSRELTTGVGEGFLLDSVP